MGCNYLSLPLIAASGTTLLICKFTYNQSHTDAHQALQIPPTRYGRDTGCYYSVKVFLLLHYFFNALSAQCRAIVYFHQRQCFCNGVVHGVVLNHGFSLNTNSTIKDHQFNNKGSTLGSASPLPILNQTKSSLGFWNLLKVINRADYKVWQKFLWLLTI